MNRESIHRHIDEHIDDHVERLQQWVRQPSVSWDNVGVAECAELVASSYRDLGCSEVEVIEGRFHPGVWAFYDAGAPLTIHSYCMFDTRPVQPNGWTFDPWGAELVSMGSHPKVLVGRGALGAKGPYVAFLNTLKSIIEVEGTLPVNIAFLAEGEEIMGSPTYNQFVEQYKDKLQLASASYCATSAQDSSGVVNVGLGLKGMVVIELTASGEAWGNGPVSTIHSSAAPLVSSPPFRLAQALATMTEKDGRGCTIQGLKHVWHYRKPLGNDEQELLDRLEASFANRDWRDVLPVGGTTNVRSLIGGDSGNRPLINFLYGPSFNVTGIRSGFLGSETSTTPFIVPHQATAMLDMRMVIEIPPDEIIGHVRSHLDEHGFADIEIKTLSAFSHHQTAPSSPLLYAAEQTLRERNVEYRTWPIEAGGGPWTAVPNALGLPCIRGGIVGGGAAGTDEYLVIEGNGTVAGLAETEKHHVDLLFNAVAALSS
jgi:acetylornithine deacetylase/succinyl-diaminopimelate desuccinylase-like protein